MHKSSLLMLGATFLSACSVISQVEAYTPPESIKLSETSFESLPVGVPAKQVQTGSFTWDFTNSKVQITDKFAHTGKQSLHFYGGQANQMVLTLNGDQKERFNQSKNTRYLNFRAERWTSAGDFDFETEVEIDGTWQPLLDVSNLVVTGARFLSAVSIPLPEGNISAFRFTLTAPENAGALIDDVSVEIADGAHTLLPTPQNVSWGDHEVTLQSVRIVAPEWTGLEAPRMAFALQTLNEILEQNQTSVATDADFSIILKQGKLTVPRHANEAYQLSVSQAGIELIAEQPSGFLYGIRTLGQLIKSQANRVTIPACEITDYPAFGIRGFMHDVGRNFQTLELLKDQIEVMAAYKLNVFHFHVTEYHGWRLESKKYPELQRLDTFQRKPGKYYTQEQFKELVDFCFERGITLIPEFDTPGHSTAFRKAFGLKTMSDPLAKERMVELIHELCTLAPVEKMPYIHLGTDEVRGPAERVGPDYLPALNKAVRDNGRQVIGWWHGMHEPGDDEQIQQTWAKYTPRKGNRHIDSRSNYINHTSALDVPQRLLFQQPCRVPHSDEVNLGGILCYWPDLKVDDENISITNAPVYLSMVGYSESTWTGIKEDQYRYWAQIPEPGTQHFRDYQDYERRLLAQRSRVGNDRPYLFVKSSHIPWQLIGPFKSTDQEKLAPIYADHAAEYRIGDKTFTWWDKPVRGGTVHVRHFFGFPSYSNGIKFEKGEDLVLAQSYIYSPKDQTVGFWINFNSISLSDWRAGSPLQGNWSKNANCKIWVNGDAIAPPTWAAPGIEGKEEPVIDLVHTSRPPTQINLKKGWNRVLMQTSPSWKWSFTCVPVKPVGQQVREVEGLKFAAEPR